MLTEDEQDRQLDEQAQDARRRRCEEAIEEYDGPAPVYNEALFSAAMLPGTQPFLMNALQSVQDEFWQRLQARVGQITPEIEQRVQETVNREARRIQEEAYGRTPVRTWQWVPPPEPRYGRSPLVGLLARQQRRQRAMRALHGMMTRPQIIILLVGTFLTLGFEAWPLLGGYILALWTVLIYVLLVHVVLLLNFVAAYHREGRRNG